MSNITFNANRQAAAANFEAAMNAQGGGIERGGNIATVEQVKHYTTRQALMPAKASTLKRDVIAAVAFGVVTFAACAVLALCHVI